MKCLALLLGLIVCEPSITSDARLVRQWYSDNSRQWFAEYETDDGFRFVVSQTFEEAMRAEWSARR